MCDNFDDFDGEFMDDGEFDDDIEDSLDPDQNEDLDQDDDQHDGFGWDDAYWIGTGLGFAYEEGRQERRKRKKIDSDDSSEID